MSDPLEINGTQPTIEGNVCEELLAEEYLHAGKVTVSANVVHLRFSGSWYRLYFDCAVVFWQESHERPTPYQMPELDSEVRIVDLGALYGVHGLQLEGIEASAIEGGSQVAFNFSDSRRVCFRNVHDVTTHAA